MFVRGLRDLREEFFYEIEFADFSKDYIGRDSSDGFPVNPRQTFRLLREREPIQNRVARSHPKIAAVRFVAQKHGNGQSQFFLVVWSYEKAI